MQLAKGDSVPRCTLIGIRDTSRCPKRIRRRVPRRGECPVHLKKGQVGGKYRILDPYFISFRRERAMGLFLLLVWCSAWETYLRCISRFGVFNSRLGGRKFPFPVLRELTGKGLIYPEVSATKTTFIGQNREDSRFYGNNRECRREGASPPAVDGRAGRLVLFAPMERLVRCAVLLSIAVALPASAQTAASPGTVTRSGVVSLTGATPLTLTASPTLTTPQTLATTTNGTSATSTAAATSTPATGSTSRGSATGSGSGGGATGTGSSASGSRGSTSGGSATGSGSGGGAAGTGSSASGGRGSTSSSSGGSSGAATAAPASSVPSWLLCPPSGAPGMEPFVTGTNLSCAP
jgi:hypothetical protein